MNFGGERELIVADKHRGGFSLKNIHAVADKSGDKDNINTVILDDAVNDSPISRIAGHSRLNRDGQVPLCNRPWLINTCIKIKPAARLTGWPGWL